MNNHQRKLLFFAGLLIAFSLSIPVIAKITTTQQVRNTSARAATTLAFDPSSTPSSPLSVGTDNTLPLTIVLTPGSNHISLVTLEIVYDPILFSPAEETAFTANEEVLPKIIEGPIYSPGKISVSLSIGDDPTKAITKKTSIGAITLKTKNPSVDSTLIEFGSKTKVLSLATEDEANENVLSATTPAVISFSDNKDVIPTSVEKKTTIQQVSNLLYFSVALPGIGSKNMNPDNNDSPKNTTRGVTYEIISKDRKRVLLDTVTLTYESKTGFYKGKTSYSPVKVPPGLYYISLHMGGYLKKEYPTTLSLQSNTMIQLPTISLTPGDIDTDGRLTALDYGIILDCYSKTSRPISDKSSEFHSEECFSHESRANADITDDGIIDSKDLAFYTTSSSL